MLDVTGAYTRPRIVHNEAGAFIESGPELDRALDSLGLEARGPRPLMRWRGLLTGLVLGGSLCGGLVWSVHFFLAALAAFDPSRVPQ